MVEYIERDAVHDLVRSLTKYAWASPGNTGHRVTVDADDVNFGVDKIPSADVAPVRHATWVLTADFGTSEFYHCSCCGREEVRFGKSSIYEQYPYCHCGAKMDGGADNEP